MGTGLIAPFYRAAKCWGWRTILDLDRAAKRLSRRTIRDDHGVLRSVSHLTAKQKSILAMTHHYRARSEIALDVASAYPGGDYFEFGSHGLGTFRSFLAAFDINAGHTKDFPETRFYAFDIFGNPNHGRGAPPGERDYFEAWRTRPELAAPLTSLEPYGALKDRCILVPGYYQDTLSEDFKARIRAENCKIGFAFLDCNTVSSYKLVFDFLIDVIRSEKMFIYLDEYYMDQPVYRLYQEFTDAAKQRYNLQSLYMRNAGSFGALFCLMPS
jgi:hypothetical protein